MTDRIGQQLGNYPIIRPIGHGGFVDVYLGEHLYLQTQVALKLLQVRLAEEDYARLSSASGPTPSGQTSSTSTATPDNNYLQATSGTPILDDPLSDNSRGNSWHAGDNCVFMAGAYHAKINQSDDYVSCTVATPTFSNFAFQVQMTLLSGDGGGILFRTGGGETSGYRFFLGLSYSDLNYGSTYLTRSNVINANLNQSYLLTAIAQGSTISLYLDKHWVTTVQDSSASSGGIGVMAYDASNATEVAFSHAQVWKL